MLLQLRSSATVMKLLRLVSPVDFARDADRVTRTSHPGTLASRQRHSLGAKTGPYNGMNSKYSQVGLRKQPGRRVG